MIKLYNNTSWLRALRCPLKMPILYNMIRILINLLFNIQFNGVQNLDIFIDCFDSQKSCESTTLICEFCKMLSYCTLNLWYDFTNVPCKL